MQKESFICQLLFTQYVIDNNIYYTVLALIVKLLHVFLTF